MLPSSNHLIQYGQFSTIKGYIQFSLNIENETKSIIFSSNMWKYYKAS